MGLSLVIFPRSTLRGLALPQETRTIRSCRAGHRQAPISRAASDCRPSGRRRGERPYPQRRLRPSSPPRLRQRKSSAASLRTWERDRGVAWIVTGIQDSWARQFARSRDGEESKSAYRSVNEMTNRIAGSSGNEPIVLGVISESALSPARFGQVASMSGRSRRWTIHHTTSKSLSSSRAAIMEMIVCKAATFEIPCH
jgi:hypothetical protein